MSRKRREWTGSVPMWKRDHFLFEPRVKMIDPRFDDLEEFEKEVKKRLTERGEL